MRSLGFGTIEEGIFRAVHPPCSFIQTDLVSMMSHGNGLSNLNETYRKYSLAPTDD